MTVHRLKTWPGFFTAVRDGDKTFELRRNDRDFQTGDLLLLQEWDPCQGDGAYTGRELTRVCGWIARGGTNEAFGGTHIEPGYCVISLVAHSADIRRPPFGVEPFDETFGEKRISA